MPVSSTTSTAARRAAHPRVLLASLDFLAQAKMAPGVRSGSHRRMFVSRPRAGLRWVQPHAQHTCPIMVNEPLPLHDPASHPLLRCRRSWPLYLPLSDGSLSDISPREDRG